MKSMTQLLFATLFLVTSTAMADGLPKPGDKRYEPKLEYVADVYGESKV